MGSHIITVDGVVGVRFAVWAPNCTCVSVVGDWNGWDGRAHPMRKRVEFGCWDLFIPGIGAGEKYGYRIHSKSGADFIKIDPYAQEFEVPPKTASIISACDDAFKPVGQETKAQGMGLGSGILAALWGSTSWRVSDLRGCWCLG